MTAVSSLNIIESTCYEPWEVQIEPFAVTDQIFYVGNKWVGAYLIDTGDGLILLDTTTAETAYLLLNSIYKLGYRPEEIKMILLSHAHVDHYGAARFLKELSGAEIWLSREDEDCRNTDGAAEPGGLFVPFREYSFETDRYYDDSTPILLGNVEIRTRLTPGHTPGVTSFFIYTDDKKCGRIVSAIHGGVGVLTMSDESLDRAGLSRELRKRFIKDCHDLKDISVDICLPSHPAHAPLFEKREQAADGDKNPFIDRDGWARFLDDRVQYAIKLEEEADSHFEAK